MIKILHSADWHMDAPMGGFTPAQRIALRRHMLALPGQIAELCRRESCDLVLLSGDIFDGFVYTPESVSAVRNALIRMEVPVFISTGNHDYWCDKSPWSREEWPGNVYFFKRPQLTSYRLPDLNCRVYGAGFDGPECPAVLERFRAQGPEQYAVMVLHGDPTAADSPYCPVTAAQARDSGLDYLALGHIHAAGRFDAGAGVCAWPGCPMGKGYDETGIKGVLIAELDQETRIRFLPLEVPRFYDLEVQAGENPAAAVEQALPGVVTEDFYRVRLTGECPGVNPDDLKSRFARFANLVIQDETVQVAPLWAQAGKDTLEGICFELLRSAMQTADPETRKDLELAAKLSRTILSGQEVTLP